MEVKLYWNVFCWQGCGDGGSRVCHQLRLLPGDWHVWWGDGDLGRREPWAGVAGKLELDMGVGCGAAPCLLASTSTIYRYTGQNISLCQPYGLAVIRPLIMPGVRPDSNMIIFVPAVWPGSGKTSHCTSSMTWQWLTNKNQNWTNYLFILLLLLLLFCLFLLSFFCLD